MARKIKAPVIVAKLSFGPAAQGRSCGLRLAACGQACRLLSMHPCDFSRGPGPSDRHRGVAVMSDRIENSLSCLGVRQLAVRVCHRMPSLRRSIYDQRRRYALSRLSGLPRDE